MSIKWLDSDQGECAPRAYHNGCEALEPPRTPVVLGHHWLCDWWLSVQWVRRQYDIRFLIYLKICFLAQHASEETCALVTYWQWIELYFGLGSWIIGSLIIMVHDHDPVACFCPKWCHKCHIASQLSVRTACHLVRLVWPPCRNSTSEESTGLNMPSALRVRSIKVFFLLGTCIALHIFLLARETPSKYRTPGHNIVFISPVLAQGLRMGKLRCSIVEERHVTAYSQRWS